MRSSKSTSDNSSAAAYVLIAVMMLTLGGGMVAVVKAVTAKSKAQAVEKQRIAQNKEAGLPEDYPSDILPLYSEADVSHADRATAKSSLGEPMHQWNVHAETDEDKQVVFDFYNKLLMDKGFAQTFFGSVPNGRTATFRNETTEVQLVVEKKKADKRTQIDIKLFRLADN